MNTTNTQSTKPSFDVIIRGLCILAITTPHTPRVVAAAAVTGQLLNLRSAEATN